MRLATTRSPRGDATARAGAQTLVLGEWCSQDAGDRPLRDDACKLERRNRDEGNVAQRNRPSPVRVRPPYQRHSPDGRRRVHGRNGEVAAKRPIVAVRVHSSLLLGGIMHHTNRPFSPVRRRDHLCTLLRQRRARRARTQRRENRRCHCSCDRLSGLRRTAAWRSDPHRADGRLPVRCWATRCPSLRRSWNSWTEVASAAANEGRTDQHEHCGDGQKSEIPREWACHVVAHVMDRE